MATPCIDCRVSPDETSRDEIQVITREKLLEGDMTMMLRSLITIGLILTSPSSNIAHTGGRASTPQTTPRDATAIRARVDNIGNPVEDGRKSPPVDARHRSCVQRCIR